MGLPGGHLNRRGKRSPEWTAGGRPELECVQVIALVPG